MNLPLLISILAEQGILTPHQASRILGLEDAPPGTRMFAHYPSREWRVLPSGEAQIRDDGGKWVPSSATIGYLLGADDVHEITVPQPAATARYFRYEDAEWRALPGGYVEFRSDADEPGRWFESSFSLSELLSDPDITETTPPTP